MASQGQAVNSEHQAFRVMDPSICTACGIEWFSNQDFRRKNNILQIQHDILNDQLFRVSHINQLNGVQIRTLNQERERYAALVESSKQAAASLQRHLDNQQASFEVERRERALAIQSLVNESARREATERSLEHERAIVQKMTGILDKFELPNGECLAIDLPDNIGLGTIFHEWASTKSEVENLRNELQHKQLVFENLSRQFQSESMSDTSFSDTDDETSIEVAESQAILTLQGMGKRVE